MSAVDVIRRRVTGDHHEHIAPVRDHRPMPVRLTSEELADILLDGSGQ